MLARSRRNWPNINPTLAQYLVLAGMAGESFQDTLSMMQWQFNYKHFISGGR